MKKSNLLIIGLILLLSINLINTKLNKGNDLLSLEKIAFAQEENNDGFKCWNYFIFSYVPGARLLVCPGGNGCYYEENKGPWFSSPEYWSLCQM